MSFLGHLDATNDDGSRGSKQEELMVFGYSCKLYRDDAKAMAEDSGVYLIPWMGDHSLMIDRYDCRGHLYDKAQFGLKSNLPRRWTAEEEAFEDMLDRERYMALDKDLREEDFRKEEEEKRLYEAMQDGYSAVGFKYTDKAADSEPVVPQLQPPPPPPLSSVIVDRPDDEDIYIPPVGLNLPNGIETPSTNKLHNIIEKTALFISRQGTQMEIRIKINQKNNPYFAFMDFNDRLHPYYKHLLRAITSGNYTPKPPVEQKVEIVEKKDGEQQLEQRDVKVVEEEQDDEEDEDSDGDYELHPLLMGSRTSSNTTDKTTNSSEKVTTSTANGHSGLAAISTQHMDHYQQQTAYAYYMDQYNTTGLNNMMPTIPMNALIEDPPHPPPPDIQPIIDKLAEYIAKHGHAFEDTVKRNGDPRLQFINSNHEYYKYFMLRKNLYRQKFLMEEMTNENKPKQVVTQDLPCPAKETTDVQTLKEDGSVGFKIATKEEKVVSGVYLGSASDEEGEEEGKEGEESSEATASEEAVVEDKDTEDANADSTAKKTTTVITTTSLPKPSVMEEQEKTKSERRKKAAMFVEQLRQKRAEKIAQETDIIGPLLPHEYKYCNRKYEELPPERVVSSTDNDDYEDEDSPSAKRMKTVREDEDDDYLLEVEEPVAPPTRMRTRLTVKSIPRH